VAVKQDFFVTADYYKASGETTGFQSSLLCMLNKGSSVDLAFLRADANGDGSVDISDAVATLGVLFLGHGEINCQDACDANDDGSVDISDAIATLGALFLGNSVIPLPGMAECGTDPTDDFLGCFNYAACQ
jgi:hypothetical protein